MPRLPTRRNPLALLSPSRSRPIRADHRPYWFHRLRRARENWWTRRFLAPQFDTFGDHFRIDNPWFVEVTGRNISVGEKLHAIANRSTPIRMTTWPAPDEDAAITLGDCVLLIAGTRIMAAQNIQIGSGVMLAANATITDSDWHGLYDRVGPPTAKPVRIGDNVWVGDGAFIGKGVSIGDNSVIGARAVITRDIPENVVAAGNPARIVKPLDPALQRRTRMDLLADPQRLDAYLDALQREKLRRNTTVNWLRTALFPSHKD